MTRFLFLVWYVALIAPVVSFGQTTEPEELQFLIIEALMNNPDIAGEVARMEKFEQRTPQASALDDPQLIFKLMEMPGFDPGRAMYANLELMQMIRFPSKLSTQRAIATVQAEHAHHDHLEKVISVIADLKSAYAMLWYARTASELTRENQQLVELILSSAQTRYAVGGTSQQDVLKTNIELAKLKTKEASLRQEEIAAESMMRAILNRSSAMPIGQISLEPVRTLRYSVDDLLAFGLAHKPMLIHDSLSVHEQDLMLSLSRQEYLPDLSLSLEYVTSPLLGHKQWSFMVGITLPFAPWTLGKASARVQEAQSERSMMASKYQASKNMLQAKIREQYEAVKAYETEILYYENTIIPQTRQSLQALMSEYQTGSASYLMLLDSYRMYQEISMDAAMARMKYEQSRARLEREVGVTDLRVVPTAEEE